MRLRIQTYKPLPELKAWFIPDMPDGREAILDLKENLCSRIQALRDAHYKGRHLILLLEGFELLNDSPIDAVRDGDLICVKLSSGVVASDVEMESEVLQTRKRKRSISKPTPTPPIRLPVARNAPQKPVIKHTKSSDSSSDLDSSSDSSSSSASSADTSSSDDESSSESNTSSASSSPPKPSTSRKVQKKTVTTTLTTTKPTTTTAVHIPPGQGKPTTHSRNKRRQKKREFEKVGKTSLLEPVSGLPNGNPESNLSPLSASKVSTKHIPLPNSLPTPKTALDSFSIANVANNEYVSTQREPTKDPGPSGTSNLVYITQDQVMMSSLRNKNKKKGYKQSMAAPIPQKIVFSTDKEVVAEASLSIPSGTQNVIQSSALGSKAVEPYANIQPRLIPPSELQELKQLPSNMFVTSVDVEAGMWGGANNARRKKKGKGKLYEYHDDDWYGHDAEDMSHAEADGYENGLDIGSYGIPMTSSPEQLDWTRAEQQWETAVAITLPEQVAVGAVVGWKGLAINPQTFSPEVLLSIARVTRLENDTNPMAVSIALVQRPGASQAALAFGFGNGYSDDGGDEGNVVMEETLRWPDILEAQWKLIHL